jgi:hypothetical protein
VRLPTIVQLVKEVAYFQKYQDGRLWYTISWSEVLCDIPERIVDGRRQLGLIGTQSHHFEFPIPIEDAGGGEFLPEDKALTFERWIRKHLEHLNGALAEGVYDQ